MRDRVHASLDLAASTGWTAGVPFGKPETGHWVLKGETRAQRFVFLRARLVWFFMHYEPIVCFIEEPLDPNFAIKVGITRDTQIALNGYYAIAELMCEHYGIRTIPVERNEALKHFTGRTGYKEKDGGKKACVLRCHQLGYPVDGFDAADAAAQWDFGCARLYAGAYAMVQSTLPATTKGYNDANFPGARGFTRRRRARRPANRTLFDDDPR